MSTTRKNASLENERCCLRKNGFYIEKRRKKYPEIVKVRDGYIADKVQVGNVVIQMNNISAIQLTADEILNWQKQDSFTYQISTAAEYNIMIRNERNARRQAQGINRRGVMPPERANRERQADLVGTILYSIISMTV